MRSSAVASDSTASKKPSSHRGRAMLVFILCFMFAFTSLPSTLASTTSISGTVFEDANRSGLLDPGEQPFAGYALYLFDESGVYKDSTVTDAAGAYSFPTVASGRYTIEFSPPTWWQIRNDWVPTTTGTLYPRIAVTVEEATTRDLGLRRIVRSGDIDSPLSTFVAPSGLRVASYNDAVTAREVHDALMNGSLIGPEAATTTIYFDYDDATSCVTSVSGSRGAYSGWSASVWIDFLSWLDSGDSVLFHEYGHNWSLYNAYIVQQDETLAAYIDARGLTGDPRLGTSKYWDPREMTAEDYRLLFGSATARAVPHANTEITAPGDVPGLGDFLRDVYTQPPSGPEPTPSPAPSSSPTPSPSPDPTGGLTISDLVVSPRPVKNTAIVAFALSAAATFSVRIEDATGVLVRTLASSAYSAADTVSLVWDRKSDVGRRVKPGGYRVIVSAVGQGGQSAATTADITVA